MSIFQQTIRNGRLLTGLIILALLATGQGVRAEDSVERALAQAGADWDAAFNRGDAEGVTALYAADAVLLPPGGNIMRGHDAIRDFWAGLVEAGFTDHVIEVVEVRYSSNVAHVVARWQASGPGEDGERTAFRGQLVNIFQQQSDGSWRSITHIWN